MGKRKRNVYMGVGVSTAGIPTRGKVDEDWELLLNTYATAYDAINNKMLTRIPGKFDPTTKKEVRGRFRILKFLARKYAPHLLDEIAYLEKLSIAHLEGKLSDREYLQRLRNYMISKGISPKLIHLVEMKINEAEGLRNPPAPQPQPLFSFNFQFPSFQEFFGKRPKKARKSRKRKQPPAFSIIQKIFGVE